MFEVQTTGTGGDCFITALKLRTLPEPLHVHHTIEDGGFPQWHQMIEDILRFVALNVREITFGSLSDHPQIYSYPDTTKDEVPHIDMDFFPDFLPQITGAPPCYNIVIANSGKPMGQGRNTKRLREMVIRDRIRSFPGYTYLLGTDEEYSSLEIHPSDGRNLVGETSVTEALTLCYGAHFFTGPVGLLSYAALAGQTPCQIFYIDGPEITKRVIGTPWEQYVVEAHYCERNGFQHVGREYEKEIARKEALYGSGRRNNVE